MLIKPIINIAEICARKGVQNAILSPGSRCAPLIIAFARHPKIETKSITDERVAAFIGLGMALHNKPTVIVCTSGTATLNYAPAITEAYYQNIPLIVLTADRPPEWVEQQDGQTICQSNLYKPHVKASYDLPVDTSKADSVWQVERTISDAINIAMTAPQGPVHINVPLREPFYPESGELVEFDSTIKIIEQIESDSFLTELQWNELLAEVNAKQIVIVAGQSSKNTTLIKCLNRLCKKNVTIIGDIISNIHPVKHLIQHSEVFLAHIDENLKKALRPDLLITFGKSIISKHLKLYLRKYKAANHWHIQSSGAVPDTYQSLTKIVRVSPSYFFREFSQRFNGHQQGYYESWQQAEEASKEISTIPKLSEFEAVKMIISFLPDNSFLHLGNSMPVRYANIVGLTNSSIEVFSNRGTSGIDGCMSTAVGYTLLTPKLNTLIIGDMAFFYDRNALWHQHVPPNLRIVVLNNHGGGIFKKIKGPSQLPELNQFFVTEQPLSAKLTAHEFGLDYISCSVQGKLARKSVEELHLDVFFVDDGKAKILEIFV